MSIAQPLNCPVHTSPHIKAALGAVHVPPYRGTQGETAREVALLPDFLPAASARLAGLLHAIAGGDRAAFGELYEATSACLLGMAMSVLGNQNVAEEALQDAYIKVWQHAGRFDERVAAPMTWLINIVRNRAIDIRRSRGIEGRHTLALTDQHLEDLAETVAGTDTPPDEQVQRLLTKRCIEVGMQALPPEQRQAVALVIQRGLTHAEIAAQFGVPLSTAKTWVRRGLMRLKDHAEREAAGAVWSVKQAGVRDRPSRGNTPKRALNALEECEQSLTPQR